MGGERRRVFRQQGRGGWPTWQFEAATLGCRRYTPPKCVAIALEDSYRALHSPDSSEQGSSLVRWRRSLAELDEAKLWELMEGLEAIMCCQEGADTDADTDESSLLAENQDPPEQLTASQARGILRRHDDNAVALRQVLAERVLLA